MDFRLRDIQISTVFPTIYNSWTHHVQLAFFLPANRKDIEVSQFLKKIVRLWLLPPAEVSDCCTLEYLFNLPNEKRVEQFCDYLLENCIDADSTFPLPVRSECTSSSLRTINAWELLLAHFSALFYSAHRNIFVLISALQKIQNETCIKMRSVTVRRFKKSATFKKEGLISSKIGQYRVNLISGIEFVSSVSFKISTKHTLVFPYCWHLQRHLPLL